MRKPFSGILQKKHVALLVGGPGAEREVSLRSGAAVAQALERAGALVTLWDVVNGDCTLPQDCDIAFNMIHGTFGEDGVLQEILDQRGIPYTGEGVRGSRLAFDKIQTKACFDQAGVPTVAWHTLRAGDPWRHPLPCVVKAPCQGSSVGVHIVRSAADADAALDDCFRFGEEVLVEDFFVGRELTVGVLGEEALPIVEIVPHDGFYDYAHKYTKGASEYHVPAMLSTEQTQRIQATALAAHKALGLEVYSRVDILLAENGDLNVMEINTIPGMTETSLLPKAAAVAGYEFSELCEAIAGWSLRKGTHA